MKLTNTQLPNGASIIAIYQGADQNGVVLAATGPAFKGYPPPACSYATWEFYRGDLKSTASGHYHETLHEAIDDYKDRLGHQLRYL